MARKTRSTKIALLSDIHGNLPALEAVLAAGAAQARALAAPVLADVREAMGVGPRRP